MTTNGPEQNGTPTPEGDWQPCPQGELGQLVGRLRSRRRNVQVRRATQLSLVAGGVFAVAVSWFALWPNDPGPAPIQPGVQVQPVAMTCGEVRKRAKEFVAGNVDGETKARIERHLGKCGGCAKFVREQRPTVLTEPARLAARR